MKVLSANDVNKLMKIAKIKSNLILFKDNIADERKIQKVIGKKKNNRLLHELNSSN